MAQPRCALRIWPLIIIFFYLLCVTQAVKLYVSPQGDDNGGANLCATLVQPCATLQHAVDVAQPSAEIYLDSGIHYVDSIIQIRQSLSIRTLHSNGSETVLMGGKSLPQCGKYVTLQYCSMFIITNFTQDAMLDNTLMFTLKGPGLSIRNVQNVLLRMERDTPKWSPPHTVVTLQNLVVSNFTVGFVYMKAKQTALTIRDVSLVDSAVMKGKTAAGCDHFVIDTEDVVVQMTRLTVDQVYYVPGTQESTACLMDIKGNAAELVMEELQVQRSNVITSIIQTLRASLTDISFSNNSGIHYPALLLIDIDQIRMNGVVLYNNSLELKAEWTEKPLVGMYGSTSVPRGGHDQTLRIRNINISNNSKFRSLVEVSSYSSIFLDDSSIDGSNQTLSNSCVWTDAIGLLMVTNSKFSNCRGTQNGGAMSVSNGQNANFDSVVFRNSFAEKAGGCLYAFQQNRVQLADSQFDGCTTYGQGGAVYAASTFSVQVLCSILFIRTEFNRSTAGEMGGAVYLSNANTNVERTSFSQCSAGVNGGAIYASKSSLHIIGPSSIVNTTSYDQGGCFGLDRTDVMFSQTGRLELNCSASQRGGAGSIVNSRVFPDSVAQRRPITCQASAGVSGGCYFFEGNIASWVQNPVFWHNATDFMQSQSPYGPTSAARPSALKLVGYTGITPVDTKDPKKATVFYAYPPPLALSLSLSLLDQMNNVVIKDRVSLGFKILRNTTVVYEQDLQLGVMSNFRENSLATTGISEIAGLVLQGRIGDVFYIVLESKAANPPYFLRIDLLLRGCPLGYLSNRSGDQCVYYVEMLIVGLVVTIIFGVVLSFAIGLLVYQCVKISRQKRLVKKLLGNRAFTLLGDEEDDESQSPLNIPLLERVPQHLIINKNDITIGDLIGSGGQAVIVKGEYRGTAVALKLVSTRTFLDGIANEVSAIATEIQLLERFGRHPSIVRLVGVSDMGNKVAIVMSLYRCSVADLVRRAQLLKRNEEHDLGIALHIKIRLLKDVASGMVHLHSHNVLHRDLKLENILVDGSDDESARAVITDLALGRFVRKSSAVVNMTKNVGTCAYMAPEVISNSSADEGQDSDASIGPAIDVYSFGILIFALLKETTMPYGSLGDADILIGTAQGKLRPRLDDEKLYNMVKRNAQSAKGADTEVLAAYELVQLMRKCWRQNPQERPTFAEILSVLEKINRR